MRGTTGLRKVDGCEAREACAGGSDVTVRFIKRMMQPLACGVVPGENAGNSGFERLSGTA
jgi:hypothetical protein